MNNHKTMNFWRVSTNINFSDFGTGDLVFFLSKNKEHRNKNEKGIVGFGRLVNMSVGSVKTMWNKYGIYNGYTSLNEFKEAIIKVSKDRKLPKKISSFYLENVTFFQPAYLSECGIIISSNIESYIYLKEEEVVMKLLRLARKSDDLWASLTNNVDAIELEEAMYALFTTHKMIRDVKTTEKAAKKARRNLTSFMEEHQDYHFVRDSCNELYKIEKHHLEIMMYHDRDIDDKLLIGQSKMYRDRLNDLLDYRYNIEFRTSDSKTELEKYMND